MKDILYFTSAHYFSVSKQQDGVVQNVLQKESINTIRRIIYIFLIGKKFLANLRMNTRILRKSI